MPLGYPDDALDITMGRELALKMPRRCFGHVHGQRARIGCGHGQSFGDGGCRHEKQFLRGVRTRICKHTWGKKHIYARHATRIPGGERENKKKKAKWLWRENTRTEAHSR